MIAHNSISIAILAGTLSIYVIILAIKVSREIRNKKWYFIEFTRMEDQGDNPTKIWDTVYTHPAKIETVITDKLRNQREDFKIKSIDKIIRL